MWLFESITLTESVRNILVGIFYQNVKCFGYCVKKWIGIIYDALSEKAMAPHSSTLAWKIPWTEEPGRLQSMGVAKSQTWLSDFTFTFHFHALEKEMATRSSILAWRIPWTEEPGGLWSLGSQSQTWLKRLSMHTHIIINITENRSSTNCIRIPTWTRKI